MTPTRAAFGWTGTLEVADLRADPSGVQDIGTVFQAQLLSGMSTVTQNVRYLSLFAAAAYLRTLAAQAGITVLPWATFLRRLEALIAVASTRHHPNGDGPTGVVGTTSAVGRSKSEDVSLSLTIRNPAYGIYRGTLADLALMQLRDGDDWLRAAAQTVAKAWHAPSGPIGAQLQAGTLPEILPRQLIDSAAPDFCVCSVPAGSAEQEQLGRWLLALDHIATVPTFADMRGEPAGWRSVSWRLALHLVDRLPGEALAGHHLMARLLRADLVELGVTLLQKCCLMWRWVAARTFFERGWTGVFQLAVRQLHAAGLGGLSPGDFQARMVATYEQRAPNHAQELLSEIDEEASAFWDEPAWLVDRYAVGTPRDHVALVCAGLAAARADRGRHGPALLDHLWDQGPIPFAREAERLSARLASGVDARIYWAELAQVSLTEHLRASLRKMHLGNPDSRLLDFDAGHWLIPSKAIELPQPLLSGAESRLDQAIRWGHQLGLVRDDPDGWHLSSVGHAVCADWDDLYAE